MTPPTKSESAITPAAFRDAANGVAWGLGAYAVVQVIARIFSQNVVGAIAVEALAAEMIAGKAEVSWSDPRGDSQSEKSIAIRAARGAAFGAGAAALAFGALSLHHATFLSGRTSIASAAFGLLTAGLTSVRDELLLRGFVVRAFRKLLPLPLLLVVCGLAAAAARWSDPTASTIEIASSAALGVAYAAAWLRDRGAWMAWGAHTAWLWTTATLGHGVVFDVKLPSGSIEGDLFVAAMLTVVALVCARFSASRERVVGSVRSKR